jgi:hypothetical protein
MTEKLKVELLGLLLEALERMVKYPEAADGTAAEAEYKAALTFAKAAIAAAKGEE